MTLKKFTKKYRKQMMFARACEILFEAQPGSDLLFYFVSQADKLGSKYENDSMSDAHWIINPLSVEDAYKLHESQNV